VYLAVQTNLRDFVFVAPHGFLHESVRFSLWEEQAGYFLDFHDRVLMIIPFYICNEGKWQHHFLRNSRNGYLSGKRLCCIILSAIYTDRKQLVSCM
jgi:hypothetical protein